ncbi:hypothetical protein J113_10895 [Mycobacterium tuberculosis CAS/NITR204]|uniref:Uncharacterized protein n=1 Tax=Mycobacterium tuberculosis CAS/NITR204 TaxID=1310114 RepID=R4MDE2_MYCTX|nr:hypothetical protein J113_10895 [Mycobacterium tuberculosis CAS/NITR204]
MLGVEPAGAAAMMAALAAAPVTLDVYRSSTAPR